MAAGMNPMDLRRGVQLAVEHVVSVLKQRAKMISTTEEIAQVQRRGGEGEGRERVEVQGEGGYGAGKSEGAG